MKSMKIEQNNSDPYAEIAEFYDLEHDDFEDDLAFYVHMATLGGGPVLELGCGSGRIMRPLLDAGLKVTGLDASTVMLARAGARLSTKRQQANLTRFEGSMLSAEKAPGGPFGVAILGLNGLLHATTSSDQRLTLTSARAALRSGGQLLLDVVNPAVPSFAGPDLQVLHEGAWTIAAGDRVDKFSARRIDSAAQAIETELWYDITSADGGVRRIHSGFTQRYVYASELELMLELAGFSSWRIFGGYELETFTEDSDRIVIAAEN
jgi:SAM-dependent methyltransferase